MDSVPRVGGALGLFLVGPEMAPLTVNDRAVYRGCPEKRNEGQKTAGHRWREIHLF